MLEKNRLFEPKHLEDGSWQLDVPNDNSCFFWAVALSYLLPSVGNPEELQGKCTILLGEQNVEAIFKLSQYIQQYNPNDCENWFKKQDLQHIISSIWRNRVVDHMLQNKAEFFALIIGDDSVKKIVGDEQKYQAYLQKMRDIGTWAGQVEVIAASQLLKTKINLISKNQADVADLTALTVVAVNALGIAEGPENHYNFNLSDDDFVKLKVAYEVEGEDDLSSDLDLQNLSLNDQVSLPSYVLNIPVAVPSDSDESSDEEQEDPKFNFPNEAFDAPAEYIRLLPAEEKVNNSSKSKKNYLRGQVVETMINPDLQKEYQSNQVGRILSTLSGTAFSNSEGRENYKRFQVVFGLNKMRSLSKARNQSLVKELNTREYYAVSSRRFGFFWDGVWQKKSNHGWVNISYEEAREFYKRLKANKGRPAAKAFRKQAQERRGHMVPYREIREAIKNHPHTQAAVKGARQSNKNSQVYLVLFDGDLVSANSAFSTYDKIYAQSGENAPVVMSGGYLVADKDHPLMGLGIELDMAVRHHTASVIRAGVYYPEPNTLALVELDKDTLGEAFSSGKLYYESPKESPILMKNIIVNRQINPQTCFRFEKSAAVITTCPQRMLREFSAAQNHEGKIISWRLADFKKMRGINQSHFKPRSWAKNILEAVVIPGNISIVISGKTIELKDKKIISDMLVSLFSRVFKAFDPIFLAKKASGSNPATTFRKELTRILENYEGVQKALVATKRKPAKPSRSKKEPSPAVKQKKQDASVIWSYIDSITDWQECLRVINQIMGYTNRSPISADDIFLAAKKSHLGIVAILRNKLSMNSTELFIQSLLRLNSDFPDYTDDSVEDDVLSVELDPAYQLLISEEAIDRKQGVLTLFGKYKQRTVSVFGAMPMHLAAIKGDLELVKWLKEKKTMSRIGWISDVQKPFGGGLLPVHCAIRYCSEQAENYELIEELIDENNINAEIVHVEMEELTAFSMIMVELRNPYPLLERLLKKFPGKINFVYSGYDLDQIFSSAVSGGYFDFANFIIEYVGDAQAELSKIIEDMSPDVDKRIIEYAEKIGVDIEEIIQEMGEYEAMDFNNNYKHAMGLNSETSSEEILEYEEQQKEEDDGFEDYELVEQEEEDPDLSVLRP